MNYEIKNLVSKRVLVVGFGLSGQSVVHFLSKQHARISVSDIKLSDEQAQNLRKQNIQVEQHQHTSEFFCNQDLIIISPGVDVLIPACQEAIQKKIPVISEIELASHFLNTPLITITGTNGKTTTTHLIHHLLTSIGKSSVMAGNVGYPLISVVDQNETSIKALEAIVVELSSFQLETIHSLKPAIALLLNINLDHLDRYPTMEAYQRAKERMFEFQSASDVAIINKARVDRLYTDPISKRYDYNDKDHYVDSQGIIHLTIEGESYSFATNKSNLQEPHNLDNLQASLLSVLLFLHRFAKKPDQNTIIKLQNGIDSFKGLSHRCELVAEYKHIKYYNDSKATNPSAVEAALRNFKEKSVILLAGGLYKETGLEEMREAVQRKVFHLISFGSSANLFQETFAKTVSVTVCDTMNDALNEAIKLAKPSMSILLSPACASYDQFKNYKERGEIFKQLVFTYIAKQTEANS